MDWLAAQHLLASLSADLWGDLVLADDALSSMSAAFSSFYAMSNSSQSIKSQHLGFAS